MVSVRSVRICTVTDDGSECCNCGSSFLMLSETEMMFAPGWRCTLTITAGPKTAYQCSEARTRGDDELLAALLEMTTWRRERNAIVLSGVTTDNYLVVGPVEHNGLYGCAQDQLPNTWVVVNSNNNGKKQAC